VPGTRREQSTRARWPSRSPDEFGTETMSAQSPSAPALSVGVYPRTPTTCALPKAAPLAAGSAMSSPSPSAEGTIVKSTLPATRSAGGRSLALVRRL